jgi:hypothetical protein
MPAPPRKTLHRQFVTLAFWLVGLAPIVAAQQLPPELSKWQEGDSRLTPRRMDSAAAIFAV